MAKLSSTHIYGDLYVDGSIDGKVSKDSAGQQINTTYIKGLSVSGKTITYTKGDGTTGTITTQDTNTTYSAATQSAAGLMSAADKTKLDGIATGANNYSHPNSGVTASSYGPSANASPAHGKTFSVPYITVNAAGHITAASTKTITLPADNNTDTKVNTTLATTTKAYLLGTSTTPTSTAAAVTAVSDTGVYLDTTAGQLTATTFKGALSGNASTASKWATARTLTIGNKGQSVNGSGNVSWTLADIGATEVVTWTCPVTCATWSRLFQFSSSNATTGGTFLVSLRATRGSVVYGPTLLVNFAHSTTCNIVQLNNVSYSNIKVRGVVNSNGAGYFEMYDAVNSATNSTTQSVDVSVVKLSAGITITKYTAFTTGATIPSGYSAKGEITTVSGTYYTGTAAKANKLATTRAIKIGNKSLNFDGSAAITYTLSDIGAAASSHGNHVPTTQTANNAVFLRNDNTWQTVTPANIGAAAASHGTHLTIGTGASNAAAGNHTHNYAGSASAGGAANSVKTNLIIKLNGGSTEGTNLFTFNGGTAKTVNITPSAIGAAASSHGTHLTIGTGASNAAAGNHTHSYLPLSGGTMTGKITSNVSTGTDMLGWTTGAIRKVTDQGGTLIHCDSSLFLHAGDNGTTVAADSGAAAALTTENMYLSADGEIKIAVKTQDGYSGATKFSINTSGFSGNAATATKLKTTRAIKIGNKSLHFDGSAAITYTLADIGAAASSHGTHLTIGTGASNAAAGNHSHTLFTRSSAGDIGWGTSSNRTLPVAVSAIAYWNGAYQDTASNLQYCDRGRFGTIVTKGSGAYLPTSGGTLSGPITVSGESKFHNGTYSDPWSGTSCAIKATGNVGLTGGLRANGGVATCGASCGTATSDGATYVANLRYASSRGILDLGSNSVPGRIYVRSGQGTAGSGVYIENKVTNGNAYMQYLSPEAGTIALTAHLSDRTRKENIAYVGTEECGFSNKDFYSFIKNNLELATYNLKEEYAATDTHKKLNFIAQDILWDFDKNEESKVGNLIVQAEDAMEGQLSLKYDPEIFTGVIAGALKESINKIETLESEKAKMQAEIDELRADLTELKAIVKGLL